MKCFRPSMFALVGVPVVRLRKNEARSTTLLDDTEFWRCLDKAVTPLGRLSWLSDTHACYEMPQTCYEEDLPGARNPGKNPTRGCSNLQLRCTFGSCTFHFLSASIASLRTCPSYEQRKLLMTV